MRLVCSCSMYPVYDMGFDLIILRHFGVIWCTCLKMACNSKMDDHRAKQTEIWESGIV